MSRILSREEVENLKDNKLVLPWKTLCESHNLLRTENERLRGALEFYKDRKNYRNALIPAETTPIEWDMGEKAREALKGAE